MPHLTLAPLTVSYQYINTMIQQNNSDTLLLSHNICGCCNSQYDLCFTLMPPPVDFSHCILDSVILELPIQKYCFDHNPSYNKVLIRSNITSPDWEYEIEISNASFYNCFLNLGITFLLQNWNPNEIPLFKMILSLQKPGLSVMIKNQHLLYPKIHIDYHTVSQNRFPPKQSYIEVCSISQNNCFIDPNGVFLYDSIECANGIHYSIATGLFSFTSSGIYYVDWMLYLRGTGTMEWIRISLQNRSTGEALPFHSPCVIPGQICGQHLLIVNDASHKFSLINSSESTIQLCCNETNASLILYKIK